MITIVCLGWLLTVIVMSAAGGWLAPHDPAALDLRARLLPPLSSQHGDLFLLGTDRLGRDELSRLMVATRPSVLIGFVAAAFATIAGLLAGSFAGYAGRRSDAVVSRSVDTVQAFPVLLLALLFLVSVGPSPAAVVFILALGAWPVVTRLARGLALEIRGKPYVEAMRALDGKGLHAVRRHVIPNLLSPIFVYGTILVAQLMLASSGLDFLGLGLQPPDTSWGVMVAEGRANIQGAWWLVTLPGLAIFLTALSFNLVATRIRESSDRSFGHQAIASGGAAMAAAIAAPDRRSDQVETSTSADTPPSMTKMQPDALLAVSNLSVEFHGATGTASAVRGVSWQVGAGEVLAIVGESGSGKTVTAKAVMGILDPQAVITGGNILVGGLDLLSVPPSKRRRLYGKTISMVHQDAVEALDPTMTIGAHVEEAIRSHSPDMSTSEARARCLELLTKVGIPDPPERVRQYPFQLSGGMCQRVVIAMAVANNPKLLIADEPTTALDVTIQRQIIELLLELRSEYRMGLVLITHDLGLVAQCADRVVVMYAGQVMEAGSMRQVIFRSGHPYSRALLQVRPEAAGGRRPLTPIPGSPPTATRLPSGCAFHPRCTYAIDLCQEAQPALTPLGDGQASACHLASEVLVS